MRETNQGHDARSTARPWWTDRIFYRVDVRAFSDADADGIGDLEGVRDRLGYLELIGIDAVWLTGVLAAPVGKPGHGREVDPLVGTLESLELLLAEAHAAGIRVILDLAVSSTDIDQPAAREELATSVRFWITQGIDGFRAAATPGITGPLGEETHRILQMIRSLLHDEYEILLGGLVQSWSTDHGPLYELDLGMDMRFSTVLFDAERIRSVVDTVLGESSRTDSTPIWTLSTWEHPRPVSRLGGGTAGLSRARALCLVQFALPGIAGVDNGTELGLPESERPDRTSNHPVRGPIPWEGAEPPFGFSAAPGSWWPTPRSWADSTVEAQLEDPASTLSLHRNAMELRRAHGVARETGVQWYGAPRGCLAFRCGQGSLTCALNTSEEDVPLPPGEVILASAEIGADRLPPDTAVWLV